MGGWVEIAPRLSSVALLDAGARVAGRARELVAARTEGARIAAHLARRRGEVIAGWHAAQFDPRRLERFGVPAGELHAAPVLARTFLAPLLELLRAWIRTGEPRFRDVYLDERLRYAPHQADWEVRRRFFDEVLPEDERAALQAVPDPALRSALAARLRELHAPLRAAAPARPVRVLALGDCLMNEVRVALVSRCRAEGLPLDFRGLYFSALYGSGLSAEQALALLREFPADVIALSFLSYKGIAPYAALVREAGRLDEAELGRRVGGIAALMRDFLARLRDRSDAPFLVHNASGLPLPRLRRLVPGLRRLGAAQARALAALNAAVAEVVAATPRCLLLDEVAVTREHGLRTCGERLVPRTVAAGGEFHTARFGELLAPRYLDVLASLRALGGCKALAVDFDNTLWDGVMADGPVRHHVALQRLLRRLREAGILLVALSKNDPRNVRWGEMELQPGDFALHKVSWDLKVQGLQEAARALDLGLDAFVLLDDNPAERELVRTQLPQVGTLDPRAPHAMAWLERMLAFPAARGTEEARRRTELYRERAARQEALQARFDYPAMMAGLELRARFGPARRADLDRIAELAQRTNQFNTTTVRYTRAQLGALLEDPAHGVYAASLADKFGQLGLVAVAVVRRDGSRRVLEAFVMSCRAMGFGLEQLVLRRVLDAEGAPGVTFVGRYLPTERNTPCSRLYADAGFTRRGEHEWTLAGEAPRPGIPAWFDAPATPAGAAAGA